MLLRLGLALALLLGSAPSLLAASAPLANSPTSNLAAPTRPTQVGQVVTWGWNSNGQMSVPANLSNVVAIAVGTDSYDGAQERRHRGGLGRQQQGPVDGACSL